MASTASQTQEDVVAVLQRIEPALSSIQSQQREIVSRLDRLENAVAEHRTETREHRAETRVRFDVLADLAATNKELADKTSRLDERMPSIWQLIGILIAIQAVALAFIKFS